MRVGSASVAVSQSHQGASGKGDTTEKEEVHEVPLVHVGDLSEEASQEALRLQQRVDSGCISIPSHPASIFRKSTSR